MHRRSRFVIAVLLSLAVLVPSAYADSRQPASYTAKKIKKYKAPKIKRYKPPKIDRKSNRIH